MPTCNNYGNITTKKENQNIINYEYDNRFRLIKYKNEEIEYDQESLLPKRCTIKKENGIIESVIDYTWVTNRLTQIIKTSGNNITKIEFEYDQEGRRTSKQVTQNNIERYRYEYIYFNNILKYERRKENTILQYEIEYLYDENSNIYGFIYRKNQLIEKYLYKKDLTFANASCLISCIVISTPLVISEGNADILKDVRSGVTLSDKKSDVTYPL